MFFFGPPKQEKANCLEFQPIVEKKKKRSIKTMTPEDLSSLPVELQCHILSFVGSSSAPAIHALVPNKTKLDPCKIDGPWRGGEEHNTYWPFKLELKSATKPCKGFKRFLNHHCTWQQVQRWPGSWGVGFLYHHPKSNTWYWPCQFRPHENNLSWFMGPAEVYKDAPPEWLSTV